MKKVAILGLLAVSAFTAPVAEESIVMHNMHPLTTAKNVLAGAKNKIQNLRKKKPAKTAEPTPAPASDDTENSAILNTLHQHAQNAISKVKEVGQKLKHRLGHKNPAPAPVQEKAPAKEETSAETSGVVASVKKHAANAYHKVKGAAKNLFGKKKPEATPEPEAAPAEEGGMIKNAYHKVKGAAKNFFGKKKPEAAPATDAAPAEEGGMIKNAYHKVKDTAKKVHGKIFGKKPEATPAPAPAPASDDTDSSAVLQTFHKHAQNAMNKVKGGIASLKSKWAGKNATPEADTEASTFDFKTTSAKVDTKLNGPGEKFHDLGVKDRAAYVGPKLHGKQ